MRSSLQHLICDLWFGDEAATAVEYAVMLALVLLAVIAAIATFGQRTNDMFGNINGELEAKGVGS